MQWQRYADPARFRAENDDFLLAHLENGSHLYATTRSLSVEDLRERDLLLARLHRDGETCAVAVVTMSSPLRPLSMSEIDDEGAAVVANRLVEEGVRIDALIGSVATAQRMARRLGVETKERFRLGNHMLDQAPVIPFCAGAMRAATMDDLEPVLAWEDAFVRECGLPYDHAAIETAIRERLGAPAPLEWLWEVDGVPVAKALGRPSNAVARISQVYTAPEQRGHGYAGALVGNLSLALQEQGCEMLFLATDMANPTSNGVYRRLGYRFVGEATHLDIVRRS